MEIKLQGRGTGKTTDILIEMLKDKDAIMVVHNFERKKQLQKDISMLAYRIITIAEYKDYSRGMDLISKVYIDELGLCLEYLFLGTDIVATHTNPSEEGK